MILAAELYSLSFVQSLFKDAIQPVGGQHILNVVILFKIKYKFLIAFGTQLILPFL
jgi:hypothetical protein